MRLAEQGGRYTVLRHALVETIAKAGRPLNITEILDDIPGTSQSSAYRNISVLIEAGAVRRVSGSADHDRFELSEEVLGHHHHHLVCTLCGRVDDLVPSPGLERAFADAARRAARKADFEVTEHRFDLIGRCAQCR